MALTVPLERIEGEARKVDVRKALLALMRLLATILVSIPYAAGWSLSKLWLGVTMLWAAAVTGWRDACHPPAESGSGT